MTTASPESPGLGSFGTAFKRLFDLTATTVVLVLLAPLMALLAVLVRLTSPGPILYRQARLGLHGRPFMILKFRSMKVDAPDLRNADGSTFSGDADPRVTAIGRILRKTSLDELPQFFNVWSGAMSLVGPRPDLVAQRALYAPGEEAKLLVKPGITGLAQINGRNAIDWETRKRYDVEYVRTQSLRLDLTILLLTVPRVLLSSGVNAPSEQATGR